MLPVTVSLCLLFSIPGKYFTLFLLYLNSLNETVSKSLLMISIKSLQFFAYLSHLFKRYGYNVSSN
nr:MAG TPA: hypothetical protein [Caudoviricetes sp.]